MVRIDYYGGDSRTRTWWDDILWERQITSVLFAITSFVGIYVARNSLFQLEKIDYRQSYLMIYYGIAASLLIYAISWLFFVIAARLRPRKTWLFLMHNGPLWFASALGFVAGWIYGCYKEYSHPFNILLFGGAVAVWIILINIKIFIIRNWSVVDWG